MRYVSENYSASCSDEENPFTHVYYVSFLKGKEVLHSHSVFEKPTMEYLKVYCEYHKKKDLENGHK